MTSERVQRRIERLLDQIDSAEAAGDWALVLNLANDILDVDADNQEAAAYRRSAERRLGGGQGGGSGAVQDQAAPSPAPAPQPAHPTSFVGGRYTVARFLGEGGKKRVYLAHDTLLDRDVAFALIKTEGLDAAGRARFLREAQAMGRLGAHPHIVTIYEAGEEGNQPYLVTELMAGGDLETKLAKAEEHRLSIEDAQRLTGDVLQGLEFAHGQGIIHRDLKPGNVWLTAEGIAKIGDFGLSMTLDRSRLTQVGMMVGTATYMPPEQAMGGEVTERSDLYALGAMLYELVCGRPPLG